MTARQAFVLVLALLAVGGCTASDFTRQSSTLFNQGNYEGALESAKTAVAMDVSDGRAWYWLGEAHWQLKQHDDAVAALEKAVTLNASPAQKRRAYGMLGYGYFSKTRYADAIRAFKQSLDIDVSNPLKDLYQGLGRAYVFNRQNAEAVPVLQKALELNPDDPKGEIRGSLGYAQMQLGKYDEAISLMKHAQQKQDGSNPALTRDLADAYAAVGNYDEAIALVRRSVDLIPAGQKAPVYFQLARLYYADGNFPAAADAYTKVAELDYVSIYKCICFDFEVVDGRAMITSVLPDASGERAGMRKGDEILRVAGQSVRGLDANKVTALVRGNLGTPVTFTIVHPGSSAPQDITATAAPIEARTAGQWGVERARERQARVDALVGKGKRAEEALRWREALEHYSEAVGLAGHGRGGDELRSHVLGLVRKLPTPPPVPEEVERRLARARLIMEAAKAPSDYGPAITEFRQLLDVAPWWVGGYFNLGLLYEKLGQHSAAIRSLKLFLKADPTSPRAPEVRQKVYELEFRQER